MAEVTRRTKAELLEEIAELRASLERRSDAERKAPESVPEAVALQGCVRALDALTGGSKQPTYTQSFGGSVGVRVVHSVEGAAADRILRFLAQKYDVDLFEVRTQPCARTHVDELDPHMLKNVIASATGPGF